jgi:glutamine amidotransferase
MQNVKRKRETGNEVVVIITIVDYKAGNIGSVQKAVRQLGYEARMTDDPEIIRKAERVLLPGVGHFSATRRLNDSAMRQAIEEVIRRGTPFMGICVGLQWMFEGSTEAPGVSGLGCFRGCCDRFHTELKVPHVGWNSLRHTAASRLLEGVADDAFVYFTHSYRAPVVDGVVATTTYGEEFGSVVERGNVFGVQFHPEKSGEVGLRILKNFCEAPC